MNYFRLGDITDVLLTLEEQRFWGELTLKFQDGKVVVYDKKATVKPKE